MKSLLMLFLVLCSAFASAGELRVVASIPDLADIAREIGGARVSVESLAMGNEDTHAIPIRPSQVVKLSRADVLIEMGLDLEHAWLPAMVDASNNPKIRPGGKANIVAGLGFVPKDVPLVVTRKEGEQHLKGNPHINLSPTSGRLMARNIAAGLCEIDAAGRELYEANLAKYLEKLSAKESEWQTAAERLRGVPFVSYHAHWVYWADYFGMKHVGTLERKPGIPPSGNHLAALVHDMKSSNCSIVVREPQYSEKVPAEIAGKVNGKVVKLSVMAGATEDTKTWIDLIDSNLKKLLAAAGK